MRFTKEQYLKAIESLTAASEQLKPDGHCCACCGDDGHQAWECGFNPLVAMEMCSIISKTAETFHEQLHWFSGRQSWMGERVGPRKIRVPQKVDTNVK